MNQNEQIRKLLEKEGAHATIKELLDIKQTSTAELSRKTSIPATTLYSSVNKTIGAFPVYTIREIFIALDIPLDFLVQLMTDYNETSKINWRFQERVRRQEDLLRNYSQLNEKNQDKVIDYSSDLLFAEKFKNN